MKLLIVEDHQSSAEALERLLTQRMCGLECVIARNLKDGLAISGELRAGITLLDLDLPGTEIEEVIKSIPLFHPPVVVVTDSATNDVVIKCFQWGAQNVLTKAALRAKIDSFESNAEADKLVLAITNAHFRHVLPRTRDDK